MRTIALATLLGLVVLTSCSKPSHSQRGPDGGSVSSDVSAIDACALLTQPAEGERRRGRRPEAPANDAVRSRQGRRLPSRPSVTTRAPGP